MNKSFIVRSAITVIIFSVWAISANAQTLNKGGFTLSGNISYSTNNTGFNQYSDSDGSSTFKNRNLSLSPSFSYLVIPNLLVGADILFSRNVQESNFESDFLSRSTEDIERSLGIGPTIKFYIGDGNFKPFAGFSYLYSKSKFESKEISKSRGFGDELDHYTQKGSKHTGVVKAGVGYFLTNSFSIEPFVSYQKSIVTYASSDFSINDDAFMVGVQFSYFVFPH